MKSAYAELDEWIIYRAAVDITRTRSRGLEPQSCKTKPLVDAGAKLFGSPAELVEDCEITVVMLLNDVATEQFTADRMAS